MRQAWHILKKDIRGYWYEISITLAVTVAFAFTAAGVMAGLVAFLLPFTWWNLMARIIHAEALPGDRQFWLTRPYRRGSLLAAKAMLILMCVNLPMLLAAAAIVAAQGIPVSTVWPGLAWSQVLLTAAFILPAAALSSLTTGFSQFLLAGIPALAITIFTYGGVWLELSWVHTYALLSATTVAAIVILIWQYARRMTAAARVFAVSAVLLIVTALILFPWTAAFWIQSQFSKTVFDKSAIQAGLADGGKWRYGVSTDVDKIGLTIPLTFQGLPPGISAVSAGWVATFEAPDGTAWTDNQLPWNTSFTDSQVSAIHTYVDGAFHRKVSDIPIKLHGSLYLIFFGKLATTHLDSRNQAIVVPGTGTCRSAMPGRGLGLVCDSFFRSPKQLVWIKGLDHQGTTNEDLSQSHAQNSFSPFPAEVGINPINSAFYSAVGASIAELHTLEPVAYVKRDFEIASVRLADLERR